MNESEQMLQQSAIQLPSGGAKRDKSCYVEKALYYSLNSIKQLQAPTINKEAFFSKTY